MTVKDMAAAKHLRRRFFQSWDDARMASRAKSKAASSNAFTLELLQAISDWQRGGYPKLKQARGERLAIVSASLDKRFRSSGLVVCRKLNLSKTPLWQLLDSGQLSETVSAWTQETDVAKAFKGGVTSDPGQSVIIISPPGSGEVVLNLVALFADAGFKTAVKQLATQIANYDKGIGRYMNSQSEVILRKTHFDIGDIYALGGHSSTPIEIGRSLFGRAPTAEEITWMRGALQKSGKDFGPWWIEGAAKDRVIARTRGEIPRLKAKKAKAAAARNK